MAVSSELGSGHQKFPYWFGKAVGQALHRRETSEPPPSLSSESERAKERQKAYERDDFTTYVGYLKLQDSGLGREDWSFQESAPVLPPNPKPNVTYGNHVLRTGDYLTISNKGIVLWEGTLRFYPDGRGYRHPLGVEEEYFLRLFRNHCRAELRTPTLATAGGAVNANHTVFGVAQVRGPVFKT